MTNITRFINYPVDDSSPSGLLNYTCYNDAIADANNGDTISIYANNVFVTSFIYIKNTPRQINVYSNLNSDEATKFLYTILESNNYRINNVKNGKTIYLNEQNNYFRLATLTNHASVGADKDFRGARIRVDNELPPNHKYLIGIADTMKYKSKNQIMGLFIKQVDATDFDIADGIPDHVQELRIVDINNSNKANLNIDLPIPASDMSDVELSNYIVSLSREGYFIKPSNYILTKNYQKNFKLLLGQAGLFLMLDAIKYIEYAINQCKHNTSTNDLYEDLIEKRAIRKLINNNAAPMKGRFNGWRFNKNLNNFIDWNLYSNSKDIDIYSHTLEYFWIIIYQPDNVGQTFNFRLTSNNYEETVSCSTLDIAGRYLIWYSPSDSSININPSGTLFDLIPNISSLVSTIRMSYSSINLISSVDLTTSISNNNKFYLESYGYKTNQFTFELALRQSFDRRIDDTKQIYLSNEYGYNALVNRFINRYNNGIDSSYPMDRSSNDLVMNIESDESINQSVGWYFDSTKNASLNILEVVKTNMFTGLSESRVYGEFHTVFVEFIVKKSINNMSFNISAFDKTSLNINSEGHYIIYMGNSPFIFEKQIHEPCGITTLSIINYDTLLSHLSTGIYKYVVTFVCVYGETKASSYSSITTEINGQTILLTNIPVSLDLRVIARKIYRTEADGSIYKLLVVLNDNVITEYLDNISDSSLLHTTPPLMNPDADNSYDTYFPALNKSLEQNSISFSSIITGSISDEAQLGKLLINIGNYSDIEIISYGYKLLGVLPIHYMSRWTSIETDPIVQNIDGYLVLQKDAEFDVEESQNIADSIFNVKAYGDFISGNYQQNTQSNTYGDIRVNVKINKLAVTNALYYLEASNLNNYTINPNGLRFTADAIALVNSEGNIIDEDGKLCAVLINNKYIIADFVNCTDGLLPSTFIETQQSQNIFAHHGGIAAVVLQGVYGALYKQFNKSSSILNANMAATINQASSQILKPTPVGAEKLDSNSAALTANAQYSYKVTYYTSIGETEASLISNIIYQASTSRQIKLTLPISSDIRVLGRKIYRCQNEETQYLHLVTIHDNITVYYIDNTSDSTLLIRTVCKPRLDDFSNCENNVILLQNSFSSMVDNGRYTYKITYTIDTNETDPSDPCAPIIQPSTAVKILINLPISPDNRVTGRKIYRTKATSDEYKLIATITNNFNTIYIDTVSDNILNSNPSLNNTSTLPFISRPSLVTIGYKFAITLSNQESYNITSLGVYNYAYTFTTNDGETQLSPQSNNIVQPSNALKVYLTLPISQDNRVKGRNIYRTTAGGTEFKLLKSINNNVSTIFIDDLSDTRLGTIAPTINTTSNSAPVVNTTNSVTGNTDSLTSLISDSVNEVNVPSVSSTLFKLYQNSGRYAKDNSVYAIEKRGYGTCINSIDTFRVLDGTPVLNTINMNLENMEIRFRCKLRGSIFDITGKKKFTKSNVSKQLIEMILGKYYKSFNGIISEPDTLVREVIRIGTTTNCLDESGYQMEMLNNEIDENGNYIVNREIQYEIIFKITLVQKTK